MASSLTVSLLSPAKPLANLAAKQVNIPGAYGYIGILPDHSALISEVGVGSLIIETEDGKGEKYFIAGGYIEVFDNQVTILADVVERKQDIDAKRAKEAKRRAEERLGKKEGGIDIARAQAALKRSEVRLELMASKN